MEFSHPQHILKTFSIVHKIIRKHFDGPRCENQFRFGFLGKILGRVTGEILYPNIVTWSKSCFDCLRIFPEEFRNDSDLVTSCTKKYARKVRHYSVRTRNQITSFPMTANSKTPKIQKSKPSSSKLIFLYLRHNWSDLLFLFILIVFYYYVPLDVYPPRNFFSI